MKEDIDFVYSKIGHSDEKFRYDEIEIGPRHWFIHEYYLYVRLAWETLVVHVGDIKVDNTKNLKIKIQIPLK